jgi:hypothetical protein
MIESSIVLAEEVPILSEIISPTDYLDALIPRDDHRTYLTVGGHAMDPGTAEETRYVVLGLTDQAETDESGRFLELSSYLLPNEARRLASLLVAQADAADSPAR